MDADFPVSLARFNSVLIKESLSWKITGTSITIGLEERDYFSISFVVGFTNAFTGTLPLR